MGLFNDITPFTLFPLPTCPESASSADVPDKDIYMPPSPNPLLSRVLRCMFTLSKSCQNSLSTVFFIIPFILNFFKKYSFSSLTYLEIKGMATVKSRTLPLRNPITLTSSPVSGRTVLILSEFKNLSISYTAFSADVNGAYPTAADVSLAPLSFPFLLNISVSSSEPGARTTLYLTFFSASTNLKFFSNHFFAVSTAIPSTSISLPPALNVALSPMISSIGLITLPPPNLFSTCPATRRPLSIL